MFAVLALLCECCSRIRLDANHCDGMMQLMTAALSQWARACAVTPSAHNRFDTGARIQASSRARGLPAAQSYSLVTYLVYVPHLPQAPWPTAASSCKRLATPPPPPPLSRRAPSLAPPQAPSLPPPLLPWPPQPPPPPQWPPLLLLHRSCPGRPGYALLCHLRHSSGP